MYTSIYPLCAVTTGPIIPTTSPALPTPPPPTERSMILKACTFAANWHGSQTRKDAKKTAYITHPLTVASMLESVGCDETVIVGSILHDVLEDTDCTETDIMTTFDADILKLVLEVTHNTYLTREEKHQHLLKNLKKMSHNAVLIKIADRTHNLRDVKNFDQLPAGFDVEKAIDYARKSRQMYNVILDRLVTDPKCSKLLFLLDRAICDIEQQDKSVE